MLHRQEVALSDHALHVGLCKNIRQIWIPGFFVHAYIYALSAQAF